MVLDAVGIVGPTHRRMRPSMILSFLNFRWTTTPAEKRNRHAYLGLCPSFVWYGSWYYDEDAGSWHAEACSHPSGTVGVVMHRMLVDNLLNFLAQFDRFFCESGVFRSRTSDKKWHARFTLYRARTPVTFTRQVSSHPT